MNTRPGLTLAMAAICSVLCTCAHAVEPDAEFSFSPDPTVEVLKLRTTYDVGGNYYVFTLFGDGRLVYRHMARRGVVRGEKEVHLSHQEVEGLLRIGVDTRLLDNSNEQLHQRINEASLERYGKEKRIRVLDGTDVILEIGLTSFNRGDQQLPLRREYRVHAPGSVHEVLPELTEVGGLVAIYQELRSLVESERGER